MMYLRAMKAGVTLNAVPDPVPDPVFLEEVVTEDVEVHEPPVKIFMKPPPVGADAVFALKVVLVLTPVVFE